MTLSKSVVARFAERAMYSVNRTATHAEVRRAYGLVYVALVGGSGYEEDVTRLRMSRRALRTLVRKTNRALELNRAMYLAAALS